MHALLAKISLSAIRENAVSLKARSGAGLIAVVKDDAYGHGAPETAHALAPIADAFAVATAEEGAALLCAGIGNVLVLTPPLDDFDALRMVAYGMTVGVTSFPALRLLVQAGEKLGKSPRVHLALNTGMNRYGFSPSRVRTAVRLCAEGGLRVEGVYTHFFGTEKETCIGQEALFCRGAEEVLARFPQAKRHVAASAGVLTGMHAYDSVRCGLSLYGYAPVATDLRLRRAMKLYAFVSHACVPTGKGAGYALADRRYKNMHTLRLGYGDGFFREGGVGAIGKLCMDACVRNGWRKYGARVCVVDDFARYAACHGTTVYEALVRLTSRAERSYDG